MAFWLRHLLHPERYHGRGRRPPFIEGWYYRLIDSCEQHRLAVIPGIYLGKDSGESHAFIQVLDGVRGAATYHRFPSGEFRAARDRFEVRIGDNLFTPDRLVLDLPADDAGAVGSLQGEIGMADLTPWPVTLRAPGIMGPYAWVPFMECYHGVVSMDHSLTGRLAMAGEEITFDGGRGYTEKDWGRSFPAAWVWMQTNHFETSGTSLTASIAIIPWLRGAFAGFIIGLQRERTLHRLATWTGARTDHLAVTDSGVEWVVSDRSLRLEMTAACDPGGQLCGPGRERMHVRVNETLNGRVEARLSQTGGEGRSPAEVLFHETGRHAGVEIQGDLERLGSMIQKQS